LAPTQAVLDTVKKLQSQCDGRLQVADEGTAEEERSELFRALDVNNDRYISFEEWLAARDKLPSMYNKFAALMAGIPKGGSVMYRVQVSPTNPWLDAPPLLIDVTAPIDSPQPAPLNMTENADSEEGTHETSSAASLKQLGSPSDHSPPSSRSKEGPPPTPSVRGHAPTDASAAVGDIPLTPCRSATQEEQHQAGATCMPSFDEADRNHDGVIDREEYEEAMRRSLEGQQYPDNPAPSESPIKSPSMSPGGWSAAGLEPERVAITADDLAAAFEGTEFSEAEEDVLVELYEAYAAPTGLVESTFNLLLLEALSFSLFVRPPVADQCRDALRTAVASGRMHKGMDFANPIFWRTFQFFDEDRTGILTLDKFARGMWKIAGADFENRTQYIFYLTDLNDHEALSEEEVLDFFTNFMEFFTAMSINVMKVEQPYLIEQGISEKQIEAHIRATHACLEHSDEMIMSQFEETFRMLDEHRKQRISYSEWMTNKHRLPKMYNKVMAMCKGVLFQYTSMFRNDLLQ